MPRYRIEYDLKNCEGNFNCIDAAPEYFFALPGGEKAELGERRTHPRGFVSREIEEHGLEQGIEAANVCPAKVIRVMDLDSGDIVAGPPDLPIEMTDDDEEDARSHPHSGSGQGVPRARERRH